VALFVVGNVFAQTVSQINRWLNDAERETESAYRLTLKDPLKNQKQIVSLTQSARQKIIQVQNALATNGKSYGEKQVDIWTVQMNRIAADVVSILQLLDQ
jgi:hypothetical protein